MFFQYHFVTHIYKLVFWLWFFLIYFCSCPSSPTCCCFPGLRALWKRGGDYHHPAGEEDPHHNLPASSPPWVFGKLWKRKSLPNWKWDYIENGLWDSDLYSLIGNACVSREQDTDEGRKISPQVHYARKRQQLLSVRHMIIQKKMGKTKLLSFKMCLLTFE